MSMQARTAFDRLGYHMKLAGYANSEFKQPLAIINGAVSDTLRIWHNDVEIVFYVDHDSDNGALCEKIDGSAKAIVYGVQTLKLKRPKFDLVTIELVLSQQDNDESNKVISRSYSTSVRLE